MSWFQQPTNRSLASVSDSLFVRCILPFFSVHDVCLLGSASKQLRNVCRSQLVWTALLRRDAAPRQLNRDAITAIHSLVVDGTMQRPEALDLALCAASRSSASSFVYGLALAAGLREQEPGLNAGFGYPTSLPLSIGLDALLSAPTPHAEVSFLCPLARC
jgi:hypothetical protein